MITEEHRAYLNRAAITDAVIDATGIRSIDTGIVFPWRDRDGTVVEQLRPDAPRLDETGRPVKYVFPRGSELIMSQLRDTGEGPILIVEGTKQQYSALSYAPENFAVYGISGCWGWVSQDKVTWVPDFTWAIGRDVFLLFDADLASNYQVHRAATEFTAQLKRSGVGEVRYVVTTARGSNGLDDVLGSMPEDRRATFLALWINQAGARIPRAPKKPPTSKFIADNGSLLVETAAREILDKYPAALTREEVLALYDGGVYRRNPTAFISRVVGLLGDNYRREWRANIEEVGVALCYLSDRILPEHVREPLLNVKNGMLDLATGTLKPHDPIYMSSVQLPIEWDPDAKCPVYLDWLQGVIPDQWEDLEEVVSTMLDPSRTPSKSVFLFGPSRSGKSTFLRIMMAIAGQENTSATSLHQLSDDVFAAADIYGSILNAAADLSAKDVGDLSVFKMLTGEDPVPANRKHGKRFKFTSRALFAFSANDPPTVNEASRAYAERIKPFRFGLSFAGREDKTIEPEIHRELPGILVRWVDAWQRMNARGTYLPTLPSVAEDFESRSNRVRMWIRDGMTVADTGGKTKVAPELGNTPTTLFRKFSEWIKENQGAPMGKQRFINALTSVNGVREVRIMPSSARGYNVVDRPETTPDDGEWGQRGQIFCIVEESEKQGSVSSPTASQEADRGVSHEIRDNASKTAPSAPGIETADRGPDLVDGDSPSTIGASVVFDLETADVDQIFTRSDFMRLGGYTCADGAHVLTTSGDQVAKALAVSGRAIGHGITHFDLPVLARWHGLDLTALRDRIIDTDLLVRLDDPPPSGKDGIAIRPRGYYGLDQSCQRYDLPAKTDEFARLARKHGGADQIPTDDPEYIEYLHGDLSASQALVDHLSPLSPYALREMNIGLMTAQMKVNGFRVDVPELTKALAEQGVRKIENFARLSEITGMPLGAVKAYKTKPSKFIPHTNPLATKDGKAAIIEYLIAHGVPERAIPQTAKGQDSLSGDGMKELRDKVITNLGDDHEVIGVLDLIIALVAERTVYQTAETCRVGDRVHPTIRPIQASGRWSVTSPGLTVYGKRGGKHVERRIFVAEEGHVIIAIDLDQVDARAVAAHSGDEGYLRIFREGLDLHAENAFVAFGDRGRREDAKPIGHGWNYGMSAAAMSRQGVEYDLAVQFDRRMRDEYPALVAWQSEVRETASKGTLLDNGFGRLMRAEPRFAYTQAPALVGQGCTRDILAEGMLRLPMEFWPMMRVIVHDELVFSVPEKDHEEIGREIVKAMSFDLADVTNGRLASCPITAGVSRPGRTWADVYEK